MKKTIMIRLTLCFLCATLLFLLSACRTDGKNPSETKPEVTVETDADDLPARDMKQFRLTFLNYTDQAHDWSVKTLVTDDISDSVNSAIYERNAYVETRFDAIIEEIQTDEMNLMLETAAMSGMEEDFQVAMVFDEKVNGNYVKGLLSTWDRMTYCDFDQKWWNSDACRSFSNNGQQYGAVGDFSLSMYSKDYCYYFNKELYSTDPTAENLYGLVRNKEWTLEKMLEIGEQFTRDLDGDGLWYDGTDQYGISGTVKVHYQLVMSGSGLKMVDIDQNGKPTFALATKTAVTKLSRIIELFNDTYAYYNSNPGSPIGGSIPDVFLNEKSLFFSATIYMMNTFKDASFPVGIMPAPMYDKDQNQYYSVAIGGEIACIPIAIKAEDTENVSILLEAMSSYSHGNLVPIYRETVVKTRYANAPEDAEMLQLIFDTTVLDLGTTIWNNDIRAPIMKNLFAELNSGVASYIKSLEPVAKAAIQKTMSTTVSE